SIRRTPEISCKARLKDDGAAAANMIAAPSYKKSVGLCQLHLLVGLPRLLQLGHRHGDIARLLHGTRIERGHRVRMRSTLIEYGRTVVVRNRHAENLTDAL